MSALQDAHVNVQHPLPKKKEKKKVFSRVKTLEKCMKKSQYVCVCVCVCVCVSKSLDDS